MTVTIQSVAEVAGVSRSTANMILTGRSHRYAAKTCERVLQTAKELEYRPNIAARSLRHKRSFLIGGIFNQINAGSSGEYLAGLQNRTLDHGCAPTLLVAQNPEEELRALRVMADRRVDGLIVNPHPTDGEPVVVNEVLRMRDRGLPIVEFLGQLCGPSVPSVKLDGYRAGYLATRQAIELGCSRPMLVMQDDIHPQSERTSSNWFLVDFYRGSDAAVKEAGHDPWHVFYTPYPGWDPLHTARDVIGSHKPGGIITLSKKMAKYFVFLPNSRPELVADNFVLCGIEHWLGRVSFRFNMVVIHRSMREAVEQAVEMLFSMIDGTEAVPKDVSLPPSVELVKPEPVL